MPRADGEFIPHSHCTVASGECFMQSRCIGRCTEQRKKDQEQRMLALEKRVRELEQIVYRLVRGEPQN